MILTKNFTRQILVLLALLLSVGASEVWGIGIKKAMSLPSDATNTSGAWTASTSTLSWTDTYSNLITFYSAQDLSDYDAIIFDASELTSGSAFRCVITSGSNNYICSLYSDGTKTLKFSDFKDGNSNSISSTALQSATIYFGGTGATNSSGSVKLSNIYLHKTLAWDANGQYTVNASDFTTKPSDFTITTTSSSDYSTPFQHNFSISDNDYIDFTDTRTFRVNATINSSNNINNNFFGYKLDGAGVIWNGQSANEDTSIGGTEDQQSHVQVFGIQFYNKVGSVTINSVTFTSDETKFVTFDANEGTCSTSRLYYYQTALTLPTPTRDRYTFIGWYDSKTDGAKIGDAGDTYTPAADVTLYAYWREQYTIKTVSSQGESYNSGYLTYTTSTNEGSVTAVFNNTNGNSRASDCDGVILEKGNTLTLTAPSGYGFKNIKVGLGHSYDVWVDFNNGSDNYVQLSSASIATYSPSTAPSSLTFSIAGNETVAAIHVTSITFELESTKASNGMHTISVDGNTRKYYLYVPESAVGKSDVPVVFSLHGRYGSCNPSESNFSAPDFRTLADANGFIVVMPQGRNGAEGSADRTTYGTDWCSAFGNSTGWEATGAENVDTRFIEELVAYIQENAQTDFNVTVNTSKFYLAGFSMGGMMTYALANLLSDKFAAFASISGFPMNEMHHQHNGPRAVPFLHIHGKADELVKYSLRQSIIDNMLARNGLSYAPTTTTNGSGYDYYAYEATGKQPYYFYAVDGMGHTCNNSINGTSTNEIMWNFFNGRTLNTAKSTIEFAPDFDGVSNDALHGWTINSGTTLAQYGESGGYSEDDTNTSHNRNVYHSIQLKAGTHWLSFNATNSDETKKVVIKLIKLGALSNFDELSTSGFTVGTTDILDGLTYYCRGNISFSFKTTEDSEYQLIIEKGDENDATTISGISIMTTGTAAGDKVQAGASTDFTGWYAYHNRLSAQWNFDSCDGFRFNENNVSSSYWTEDDSNYNNGNGTKLFTYNQAIGTSGNDTNESTYSELTYDGTDTHKVAITAGLRFKDLTGGNIKIRVSYSEGKPSGVHLIVNENVKMLIPYVENTYRNDKGNNDNGPYNLDTDANKALYEEFKNCVHHWKRDILYLSVEDGSAWGYVVNKCIDDSSKDLFNSGGEETIDSHYFNKMNYMGNAGIPCVLQFQKTTSFNRIGVNRNLTYSFYSEYVSDFGTTYTMPTPRMRVVANPQGQKIANLGSSALDLSSAIAMTYGGWKSTSDTNTYGYKAYNGTALTDSWSELGIYHGGDAIHSLSDTPDGELWGVPAIAEGFPIVSQSTVLASSESLMPSSTTNNKYHVACEGKYSATDAYKANYTPWTLPCRGAYLKFEPRLPGVLNLDLLLKANATYYIVDEFGSLVTENVYCKTASSGTSGINKVNSSNAVVTDNTAVGFRLSGTTSDYAKFSFDVYPGKSYYVFSNDFGIGFAGLYYEPYVYRKNSTDELARKDIQMKTWNLTDDNDYKYDSDILAESTETIESPTSDTDYTTYDIYSDHKAVEVNLTLSRTFQANTWSSICLPFSMNQNAMEKVFGKGTKVALLRDVQDADKSENGKVTAYFIMHENQDILAGYPYIIYPAQDVSSITTNAYIPTTEEMRTIPTVSSVGFNTNLGNGDYGGMSGYSFTGNLESTELPAGSYVMASNGKLTRLAQVQTAKPYRAYMAATSNSSAKMLQEVSFGSLNEYDQTTAIEDVIMEDNTESGSLVNNGKIYNMQGQVVRTSAGVNIGDKSDVLRGLPKGIYVINGKKYMVK